MPTGKPGNQSPDHLTAEQIPVSKSQLKRDALAMKTLAADLLELRPGQLQLLSLEADVLLAIEQAQHMRSHGARKRQLLYVAKLLRRMDQTELMAAVTEFQAAARGLSASHHRAEAWRASLLDRGDDALTALLRRRDLPDAQALRQLVRKARQENLAGKPPAAARALFRELRALDAEEPLPPMD